MKIKERRRRLWPVRALNANTVEITLALGLDRHVHVFAAGRDVAVCGAWATKVKVTDDDDGCERCDAVMRAILKRAK